VDARGASAVSQGGGVLLVETIRAAGLDEDLSRALAPWRKPGSIHDPAKMLLDLAVAVALGGDCLADAAVVRAEPAVFGLVASDATISRAIAGLARDARTADAALAAVDQVLAAARTRVWRLAADRAPDHEVTPALPVVVDVDGVLVTAHSDKEQAAPTFKKGFGHHPLVAFVDHGPNGTGEPVGVLLRRGNAGSNTATDHLTVLRQGLRQLPGVNASARSVGRKVLVRIDGAGCSHAVLATCTLATWATRSGSPSPTPLLTCSNTSRAAPGPMPTTPKGRSVTVRWSPSSPACWIWPAGHRACGSSPARSGPTPAPSCGSPTSTGGASPRSPRTPRLVGRAASCPTWSCGTAAAPESRTASDA
jgi:hypothetical protein